MKKEQQTQFAGSEETLYGAAEIGWQNCLSHITAFQNFSAAYNPDFIAAQTAAITVAKALPNIDKRLGMLTSKRALLTDAASNCTHYWQTLLVYIQRSFAESQLASMRKIAGGEYYVQAAHQNWKSLDNMLIMASDFITTYIDDLKNGNMPATFEADFNAKKTTFEMALKDYSDTKTNIQKDGDAKLAANNAVYQSLMTMLRDAKAIFRKQPNNKKIFTYTALAKMVGKKGRGGFRVSVKELITRMPVTTTTLLFQPGNITAFVNAGGIAEVHLPKGVYSYTATTPGYDTAEGFNLQATAGVMHRVDIMVNKVAAVA